MQKSLFIESLKMTYRETPDNFDSLESYGCENECVFNSSTLPKPTEDLIQVMIPQILQHHWENLSYPLSEWQRSQLENLGEPGVSCMLKTWLINQTDISEATYCNGTWDNVYCWPPTPSGNVAERECSEILEEMKLPYADKIQGRAYRVCLDNGSWLWDNWTNYTQCADSYDIYTTNVEHEQKLVVAVQIILFVGSMLSLVCLAASLSIFYYFKCLWCDRVTVHVHLMLALMLRCALLIVITEPFLFNRTNHYRNDDFICKTVLSINHYAAVASINWMFIQGLYLHGRLTNNIFDQGTPFKTYYLIGWVLPMGIIGVYAAVMETFHPVKCWKDYSERSELWILLVPIIFALSANFLFLINIMRILLTKVRGSSSISEAAQVRRALKATIVLFPLLGINNLLFLYNPGGELNKYFVIFNAIFGSTQGFFVAFLYCFVSRDVRDAIRREYRRFLIRRSANNNGVSNSTVQNLNDAHHFHDGNPCRPRVHFRSRLAAPSRQTSESSGPRHSGTTTIEMVPLSRLALEQRSETPCPSPAPATLCSCCIYCCRGNSRRLQDGGISRYSVAIPFSNFYLPDGR